MEISFTGSDMRVALFHDYFGAVGGGERVVLMMADALDADIYTTDMDAAGRIAGGRQRIFSIGETIKSPLFKQLSAAARFSACDFSEDYDFFIFSGNWAHYAARKHHPNLWYCHILIGAMNDDHIPLYGHTGISARSLYHFGSPFLRYLDRRSMTHVDSILANSRNTCSQILSHYGREADVLYPAIDVSSYAHHEASDYWLSVNRLYPEKRIELQIESFRLMPEERLVIVGGHAQGDHSSSYIRWIMQRLPPNVTVLGEVPFDDLRNLYAHSKGLICTSFNEPFGITPLEAMASGKPVIATKSGGFLETVTDDVGRLVEPDPHCIVRAVREISKDPEVYRDRCCARARLFDRSLFNEKLRDIVYRQVEERHSGSSS